MSALDRLELTDEVLLVFYNMLAYEDEAGVAGFTGFSDSDDSIAMMMKAILALKNDNPPDTRKDAKGWILFVMNQFIEFYDNISPLDIKSLYTRSVQRQIMRNTAGQLLSDPETWPISHLSKTQEKLNQLLIDFANGDV